MVVNGWRIADTDWSMVEKERFIPKSMGPVLTRKALHLSSLKTLEKKSMIGDVLSLGRGPPAMHREEIRDRTGL